MNAGRVELDLVAVGKDQVSAMLRQVDAALKKTAGEMKSTGDAAAQIGEKAEGFGDKLGSSMKSSVGPIDKVRSGFELLRSNAGFLAGGIGVVASVVTGAVSAFLEFANGADKGAAATRKWDKDLKGFNAAIDGAWEALDKSTQTSVEKALSKINEELFNAKLTLADISKGTQEWWDKTRQLRNMEEARAALYADMARDAEKTRAAIAAMVRPTQELSRIPLPLWFSGISADPGLAMDRDPITGEAETPEMRAARLKRLADAIKNNPARRGGGGRAQTKDEGLDALFGRGKFAAAEAPDGLAKLLEDMPQSGIDRMLESMAAKVAALQEGDVLPRLATDAEKVRDAFAQVADAIGIVSAEFPELGAAMSEISDISDRFAAGQVTLAGALAAGGVAIVANAAKAVGGVKAEAAVRAAYEVGMGFATLANPIESAGHFTAAALLGAVAAGAGGGGGSKGGGRGASASSGGGNSGNSGPSTIVQQVNQYPIMFGDRQTIVTATREGERSARGTGASSRRGA